MRVVVALVAGLVVVWALGDGKMSAQGAYPGAGYPVGGYPAPPPTAATPAARVARVVLPLAVREPRATVGSLPSATVVPMSTGTPTVASSRTPSPVASATRTVGPEEAAAGLFVAGRSDRAASSGAHHVYLRVENRGTAPVYRPEAVVTFRGAGGAALETAGQGLVFQMLAPGEASTTMAIAHPPPGWTSYDVRLVGQATSPARYVHDGMVVSDLTTRRDGDNVFVEGELRNGTTGPVEMPIVDVALYGPDGGIVDHTALYPFGLGRVAAGAKTRFSARSWSDAGSIPDGYRYEAAAEAKVPSSR